uniref:Uncharacterized protein n=1 Tax=Panagrolaimus superbus TaxID=310955 RepID=A0A914YLR3_9BILA
MDFNFLNNFVVRKGFLLPSFDALSDALCEAAGKAEVKKQRAKEERLKIVPKRKRIQFTDENGQKAYADICDPEIITAITVMLENKTSQILNAAANDYCRWNAYVSPRISTNQKLCLVRDSSGYITLKQYMSSTNYSTYRCRHGQSSSCSQCAQLFLNDDIIVPVIPTNSNFYVDGQCIIEFV